jgi:hypothetical protein
MPGAFAGVGVTIEDGPAAVLDVEATRGKTDSGGGAATLNGGDQIPAFLHDLGARDDDDGPLWTPPSAARVSASIARAHVYLGGRVRCADGRGARLTRGAIEGIRGTGENTGDGGEGGDGCCTGRSCFGRSNMVSGTRKMVATWAMPARTAPTQNCLIQPSSLAT